VHILSFHTNTSARDPKELDGIGDLQTEDPKKLAALMPLTPPPTISTSHLMDLLSGGQYLNCFVSKVVNHQSWLIIEYPLEVAGSEVEALYLLSACR
jgi:hypothetical protein